MRLLTTTFNCIFEYLTHLEFGWKTSVPIFNGSIKLCCSSGLVLHGLFAETDKTEVQEGASLAKDVSPNDLDLRPEPESTLLKDVQTRVLESGVTIKPTMKKKGKK